MDKSIYPKLRIAMYADFSTERNKEAFLYKLGYFDGYYRLFQSEFENESDIAEMLKPDYRKGYLDGRGDRSRNANISKSPKLFEELKKWEYQYQENKHVLLIEFEIARRASTRLVSRMSKKRYSV